jgi:hypothetical protein
MSMKDIGYIFRPASVGYDYSTLLYTLCALLSVLSFRMEQYCGAGDDWCVLCSELCSLTVRGPWVGTVYTSNREMSRQIRHHGCSGSALFSHYMVCASAVWKFAKTYTSIKDIILIYVFLPPPPRFVTCVIPKIPVLSSLLLHLQESKICCVCYGKCEMGIIQNDR